MNENNPLVCVIDDESSIRESLSSLLRSAGLKVQAFSSAQEFLASATRDALSCLVLDVQLPGISGLDLQQELASGDAQIPIIFITGHGDIPMSVRAIALRMASNRYSSSKGLVKNSKAPALIACTLIGMSPWPVMKIMGI